MDTNNQTDVMQLFVIMVASIFGPSMAAIIGPYILIAFAAATGAGWSLGRREPKGKASALFYFVRVVFTAVLLTVGISKIAAGFIPSVEADWLVAPVALIIGLIGDDWYKIGEWFVQKVKLFVDRKMDGKE
jgi:hypothetical protein